MNARGWVKLPITRAVAWSALSGYVRAMGTELFRVHQENVVQVSGDWRLAFARSIELDGRDRAPFYRALDEMVAAGVLAVTESTVQLLYTDATLASHRTHLRRTSDVPPTQLQHTLQPQLGSSTGNHSNDASQIDREIDREEGSQPPSIREAADPVTSVEAAAEWHAALMAAGYALLHAEHAWRTEYETVAAACNATDAPGNALHALCRWFWTAPDGPVESKRVRPHYAQPGNLAKYVSSDLEAAYTWWRSTRQPAQEAAQ